MSNIFGNKKLEYYNDDLILNKFKILMKDIKPLSGRFMFFVLPSKTSFDLNSISRRFQR
jgi:hypothetical protein